MVVTILLACGVWTLVRTGGVTGTFNSDLNWRWTKTPEERLLAQSGNEPATLPPVRRCAKTPQKPLVAPAERASRRRSRRLPQERRREPTGPVFADPIVTTLSPACGSRPTGAHRRRSRYGAGRSDRVGRRSRSAATCFYTQEQRGPDEIVACYKLTTGEPVWAHRDTARFWESNGGAGPRGTPTLSNGRVYTFGATGILNALERP